MVQESCAIILPQFIAVCVIALKERISTAIRIASYPVADKHWSTSEFYNDIFNFQTGVADLQRQI